MRKCISVLLCVILLLSLCAGVSAAENPCMDARVTVKADSGRMYVKIYAAQTVANARISVSYDPAYLTFVGVAANQPVMSVKEEEGLLTVGLAWSTASAIQPGELVLDLGFDFTGGWDETALTVGADRWNGKAGESVSLTVEGTGLRFVDVQPGQWFYEAVDAMAEAGYIKGIAQNLYGSEQNMRRADFVTLLGRLDGVEETQEKTPFVDVPVDSYYSGYVAWAAENEITNGVDLNHFDPIGDINRAQMVTFLYRYAEYKGMDVSVQNLDMLKDYSDGELVAENTWAADPFAWAVENGIIDGMDGMLNPYGNATRAQVAVMLYRFFFGQ